jgi:hypothetical protein
MQSDDHDVPHSPERNSHGTQPILPHLSVCLSVSASFNSILSPLNYAFSIATEKFFKAKRRRQNKKLF